MPEVLTQHVAFTKARKKQIARLTREETLGALQLELSNKKTVRLSQLRKFARPVSLQLCPASRHSLCTSVELQGSRQGVTAPALYKWCKYHIRPNILHKWLARHSTRAGCSAVQHSKFVLCLLLRQMTFPGTCSWDTRAGRSCCKGGGATKRAAGRTKCLCHSTPFFQHREPGRTTSSSSN